MADVRSKNPFELLGEEEETAQQTTKLTRNEKKVLKNEVVDNSRATPRENRLRNEYPKRGGFAGKTSKWLFILYKWLFILYIVLILWMVVFIYIKNHP